MCVLPNRDCKAGPQRPAGAGHPRSASRTSSHGHGVNLLRNHSATVNKGTSLRASTPPPLSPPLNLSTLHIQSDNHRKGWNIFCILDVQYTLLFSSDVTKKGGCLLLYSVDKTKIGTLKALLSVQSVRPNVTLTDDKASLWDRQITSHLQGRVQTVTEHCQCHLPNRMLRLCYAGQTEMIFLQDLNGKKQKREEMGKAYRL